MPKRVLFSALLLSGVLAACGRADATVPTRLAPTLIASVPTAAPEAAADVTAVAGETAAEASGTDTVPAPSAGGNASAGQQVFNTPHTMPDGAVWACSQCHSINEARLIGPGLGGLSQRAAARVQGESAADYIHNSILHPNDFIVPGDAQGPYPSNLMPAGYAEVLSEQELNDLIAYLLTL